MSWNSNIRWHVDVYSILVAGNKQNPALGNGASTMFISLILITALATPATNTTELKTINFYQQTTADADDFVDGLSLGKDETATREYLRKYIELYPTYLLFKDFKALNYYDKLDSLAVAVYCWEYFDSVKVGDSRFSDLWANLDRVKSVLGSPLGAGYLWLGPQNGE